MWDKHLVRCKMGHKPKFYMPRTMLDEDYGHKRKCDDFVEGVNDE